MSQLKLHKIKPDGRRTMCGPGAISAITGKPVSDIKEAAYDVKGCRYICGMTNFEVEQTLLQFGYHANCLLRLNGKVTFAKWLRDRKNDYMMNSLFLVQLTKHYVVVKGRKMVDNHTMEPVFIRKAPHRRRRVQTVWVINKLQ